MLDFGNDMKVVCVSFKNSVYPISHACKFINESNVSGWTVTFVGEDFTNATIICDSDSSWNEVFFYCTNKMEELSEIVYDRVE